MSLKQYEFLKRQLDVIVAIICIIFLAPLFLAICLVMLFDFTGPIIFMQKRAGKNGQPFTIYKFRSMKKKVPAYMLKPKSDDASITGIGKLLRDTGLDEMPQLFNVLKGEMSLIGPRPEMPFVVEGYTEQIGRAHV